MAQKRNETEALKAAFYAALGMASSGQSINQGAVNRAYEQGLSISPETSAMKAAYENASSGGSQGSVNRVYDRVNSRLTAGNTREKEAQDEDKEEDKKEKKEQEKDTGLLPENGKWLKKGSGEGWLTTLATGLDAISDFGAGFIGTPESIFRGAAGAAPILEDVAFYTNGGIYTLDQENVHRQQVAEAKAGAAELITKDFYDEDSIAKSILTGLGMVAYNDAITSAGIQMTPEDIALSQQFRQDYRKYLDEEMEGDSILGEQMDGLARSAGQMAFTKAIGGAVPWQLTTGLSTMGDEMAQALNEGATFEEAGLSGMVSAAGEVLSEYIFDADIFGHSSMDEKLVKAISSKVSNKVVQSVLKFGMDATGEGLEEVVSGVIGAIGQKLTYGSDKEIKELFSSEDALDSFIGGAIMGGVNSAANTVISKATGTDYVSGLSKSEQAVVDKVYNEQLAKAKKNSKNGKVSASEKTAIYNDVLNSLEKGYLSTDAIEQALGGQTYEDYRNLMDLQEDNDLLQEYEDLGENGTLKDRKRYDAMESRVQRIQQNRQAMKQRLDAEVGKQVQGTKLQESYTERTRRGQTFQADLSQYEGKQKEIVQKAVESGVLNNTNRTHEFVDLISSIAAQSGVDYDFTNNATLKNSGFAVEGKQVNGYTTAGGVTVNVDSTKALNRVVGHEITHVLEGTELYPQLQTELFNYAREKGELASRWNYTQVQYKNMDGVDPKQELAAELAGDYLFSDQKFLDKLAQENPNAFQKAWAQIKTFAKIAGTRSKEGKQFEKVKQLYEDAYRKAGEGKKNATNDGGVKYSISETTDGRPVAVVDNDILKNIDTTKWDKETKKKVRQAATETLKQFKDGFEINGVEYVNNRNAITEYTKSNYSEALANKNPDVFQDKMRATDVIDDVIHVATDWTKDGKLKHERSDFVDFIRGKTLFQSGENAYSATVVAGITKNGKAVFYDVVDIVPNSFEVKKSELPTTDPTDKPSHGILGSSDLVGRSVSTSDAIPTGNSIAPNGENIKYNVLDNFPSTPQTKADVFGDEVRLESLEDAAPEITAPTREDIAKVEQAMDDNFAPIREDVAQRQKLEAEQTRKKDPSPAERAAKQYLEQTFTLEKAPDAVKEQLGPKWQKVKEATSVAQNVILNGDKGIKPLAHIQNKVNQDGFGGEFELYMRHLLNVDRMTLEERGYSADKQVFSTDVTAAESRETADKILQAHPEFAEYEADVRAYVHYLRKKLVDCGKISQKTADLWEEMYPHYIPIRRRGFENGHETWELLHSIMDGESWVTEQGNVDDDLFAVHTATVSELHEATGGKQQLYPLFDTLAERTLTTFWNAALMDENSLPDDFAPIREDAKRIAGYAEKSFSKGEDPKQSAPDPARRTIQTEPSADNLNVDSHDSEKPGSTVTDDSVNYDIRNVSAEVSRKMNPLKWIREMILDNGMVFEELSHRTGNKNLEAYWSYIRNASGAAQHIIGNGVKEQGISSITDIYTKALKAGKLEDFYSYLGHCRNIDGLSLQVRYGVADNQGCMGYDVTLADSVRAKLDMEQQNPEFRVWARQCYDYTNYQLNTLQEHGILSQEDVDIWKEVWPSYIPIRQTGDGNNAGILETMAQQTLHVKNGVAMNDFARELMHALDSKVSESKVPFDEFLELMDRSGDLFTATRNEQGQYFFNCYEDGNICQFQISEEMYLALKPQSELLAKRLPVIADFSELRRKVITEYNLFFALKNSVKDFQTVLIQSQHPAETYATMLGSAQWDILTGAELYQEYLENGGEESQYFHRGNRSFDETAMDKVKRYTGLEAISTLNNFIETVPRYAEYKVSRQKGASIQVAMLDAARVTTNFAAGGQLTKFANRNGATFLNASVQGAVQLARNVREAQLNGWKGWLALAARCAVAGVPELLEHLFLEDDEDYQALPDYIKQNYYILWKTEDGEFFRMPKERTMAVIQNAVEQVMDASTGDDTLDLKEFFDVCMENLAPNNPITNNVFSPIAQVAANKTWFGTDLVSQRLQELPTMEQYDEKTSNISIHLAQALQELAQEKAPEKQPEVSYIAEPDFQNAVAGAELGQFLAEQLAKLSPKQLHYLIDQYSGVVGDVLLPMDTPKAEGKTDSLLGKIALNPLRDIFTTDPVLNNRVTDQFYTTLEELETQADAPGATMEDKLKSSAAITCNADVSRLYEQMRQLQTSDLPDSEKYQRNREIKARINARMEQALDDLTDIQINGNYAEVGDERYHYSINKKTGEASWWRSSETKADGTDNEWYISEYLSHENLGMDYADIWNGNYPTDYSDKNLYAEYKGKRYNFDTEEKTWYEVTPKKADGTDNYYYQQEQLASSELGVDAKTFWNDRERYSDVLYAGHLWDSQTQSYSGDYYTTIRCVLGVEEYAEYCAVLPTLKADVDSSGNAVPYSKQNKIKSYLNSLDIPEVQKHILYKVYYPNSSSYNYEILHYLNGREDIPYLDKVAIWEELGAKVDEHGYISW